MNPTQVAALLKTNGANDKAVANFLDNNITGDVIAEGLSDDDLNDLGFTTPVQRRGIKGILKLILLSGWLSNNDATLRRYKIMHNYNRFRK